MVARIMMRKVLVDFFFQVTSLSSGHNNYFRHIYLSRVIIDTNLHNHRTSSSEKGQKNMKIGIQSPKNSGK